MSTSLTLPLSAGLTLFPLLLLLPTLFSSQSPCVSSLLAALFPRPYIKPRTTLRLRPQLAPTALPLTPVITS